MNKPGTRSVFIRRWIALVVAFPLVLLIARHVIPVGSAQQSETAELIVQSGHTAPVTAVAISPDGRLIASGSLDGGAKLWNAETGQQLRSFQGHSLLIRSIAFSHDGLTVATGSMDGTVGLWNVANGELIKKLPGDGKWIYAVAFSPDGVTLAAGKENARIQIWNYRTGELRHSIWQHRLAITTLAFSDDGTMLATGSLDRTLRIWDPEKGVQRIEIPGQTHEITTVRFLAGEKAVVCSSADGSLRTWNAESGQMIRDFDKAAGRINSISVSPDGKTIAGSIGRETSVRLWNVASGKQEKEFSVTGAPVNAVEFAPTGALITGNGDASVRLWNIENGTQTRSLVGHSSWVNSSAVSPDGKIVATANADGTVRLWNLSSGTGVRTLLYYTGPVSVPPPVNKIAFSPDGKLLASGNADNTVTIWDVADGKLIRKLTGHSKMISALSFAPDGKTLASGSLDLTARIWDLASDRQATVIDGNAGELFRGRSMGGVFDLEFAPDGNTLAIGSGSRNLTIWDTTTGTLVRTLDTQHEMVLAIDFSPDGKKLASSSAPAYGVKIWDAESGTVIDTLTLENREMVFSLEYSPDGKLVAAGTDRHAVVLWDPADKRSPRRLAGHGSIVNSVGFTPDGKSLVSSGGADSTTRLWPVEGDRALATMTTIDRDDWVVTTPDGLFDASPSARKLMHYVLGVEAISLEQMKDTYFVPGLIGKVYRRDPLPRVRLFSRADLFPDVEFDQPKVGQTVVPVKITNRGGGIGQVQVLVNGKEIIFDARPAGVDVNSRSITLSIDLRNAPLVEGGENLVEVIARNSAGSLSNKSTPRSAEKFVVASESPKATPNIYIIAGGISKYTGDQLSLNFAAKDAEDFASAIAVGATRLLNGDTSKVRVRLLTSNGASQNVKFAVPDAKVSTATKADFERAFADFRGATSNDVFIVYLAGHGVSLNTGQNPGQQSGNTYLYLTQEATTADRSILSDDNARKAMTISGDEIKDMMKQNKSLKQVLILDTCAAGAASGSFVAKRDLPSDQIAALERLKDTTGFYILMGSAADRVSYEASQYAQGLLTYSLLQGMKGAMLRDDQYADVEMLFGYAKNMVGQLAKNIGGIQRPETITPDVSRSFDIGQFTAHERNQITLSSPIPLVLRPRLTNPKLRFDNLGLEKIFRAELRAAGFVSERGDKATLVFVESDEMPDAILPSGDYTIDGDILTINLVLVRNGEPFGGEIKIAGKVAEKDTLIKQLVQQIGNAK